MVVSVLMLTAFGATITFAPSSEGAVGDQVHQFTVPVSGVETHCSVGLAFDGSSLYYDRCGDENIYQVDPLTGALLDTFATGIPERPNALAFDAKRNGLWIGTQVGLGEEAFNICGDEGAPIYFWDFDDDSVTHAFTIPKGLVNPATGDPFLTTGGGGEMCFVDGLAYNENDPLSAADDELWFNTDVSDELGVFRPDGTLVAGYDATTLDGSLDSTSGLALGGTNLYLGNNGGGDVFRADVSGGAPVLVDTFIVGDERQEDMACDPVTFFPQEVMWVRTTPQSGAFPDVITAYEVEPGTCGVGGEEPEQGPCPLTQGFWKNHGPKNRGRQDNEWPQDVLDNGLVIGGELYTAEELQKLLRAKPKGDASIVLAHQLIAAELNFANGATNQMIAEAVDGEVFTMVFDAVQDAHQDLDALGDGPLGYDIDETSADGLHLLGMSLILENFNEGVYTQGCNTDLEITKIELIGRGVTQVPGGYRFTVTNHGPQIATNTQVTDQLPLFDDWSASHAGCSIDAAAFMTCSLGDLAPGDVVTVDVTRIFLDEEVCGVQEEFPNHVEVSSETLDPNLDNNAADATLVVSCIDLSVDKNVGGGGAFDWSFTIVVTNHDATRTARFIQISDTLMEGEDADEWSIVGDCDSVTTFENHFSCFFDELAPGDTFELVVSRAEGEGECVELGGVSNNVLVAFAGVDADPTNNTDSAFDSGDC